MGRDKPGKPRRERPAQSPPPSADELEMPKFTEAVKLLGHTGARDFQIRWCEEEKPVVWMALVSWDRDDGGDAHYEVAASLTPVRAVLRLCEQLLDGGICLRCNRPTGFEPDNIESMPADEHFCWFQWDPELKTYRRGCSGDVEKDLE